MLISLWSGMFWVASLIFETHVHPSCKYMDPTCSLGGFVGQPGCITSKIRGKQNTTHCVLCKSFNIYQHVIYPLVIAHIYEQILKIVHLWMFYHDLPIYKRW